MIVFKYRVHNKPSLDHLKIKTNLGYKIFISQVKFCYGNIHLDQITSCNL